ncbi:antiterminator Q family protein [Acinetobacter baumannii]|uniref:Antitermination protein n=2 Tax=Acinetobacter baumannii TaxID=470 RepID=A0A5N5XVC7_ACIBA|nr:antiterminator Q family protein [Acinetobacter baumannii]EHU1451502.1 antitermination protein [Acinetobacter baumannii]EHU1802526.1 antitermination protein [Acinetobacter baumannii]EHU2880869.1 antitermination protein [Acinetobacter baumannii]EHU3341230.1 antitermination protein [Acinetobacter baumannii]EIB7148818.1 antitermination protein [Acinetobacter baumannii]
MNAKVNNKTMDWSKRSAHQWLEQYGLWVRSTKSKVSANPLACLIDQNDTTRIRSSKVSMPCEIEDYEAVEVSKLLAKMHNDNREFLQERAWFLILYYENNWSYLTIASVHRCSKAKVRAEIDKGLAYLDGKIEVLQS